MPSVASLVVHRRDCSASSCSRASAIRRRRSARSVARIDRTASGAAAASERAQANAALALAAGFGEPVGQSDVDGLLAADPAAGQQQVGGDLPADEVGERDAQRESLVETQQGEVGDEPGRRVGDPEVGGAGQAEPTADGRALHGGDDRDPDVEQLHRAAVQAVRRADPVGGEVAAGAEVGARAEVLALRGEHDRAAVRVVEFPCRVDDPPDECLVEVVGRRAAHLDQPDPVLDGDRQVIHGDGLLRSAFPGHRTWRSVGPVVIHVISVAGAAGAVDSAGVLIRRELPADAAAIHALTEAAFGRPTEATLVDELRADPGWLPALSLVAVDGDVVGHVVATRGRVGDAPALGIGPLSVRPDHQRRGVGSALMHAILGAADALDEPLVVLLGSPDYYRRFGFLRSTDVGVTPPVAEWGPHFQARPLTAYDPALRGVFTYAAPFDRVG